MNNGINGSLPRPDVTITPDQPEVENDTGTTTTEGTTDTGSPSTGTQDYTAPKLGNSLVIPNVVGQSQSSLAKAFDLPDYRAGSAPTSITTDNADWDITFQSFYSNFSSQERTEIDNILDSDMSPVDKLHALEPFLDSPERIAAFSSLVRYDFSHMFELSITSPADVVDTMRAVCRDHHAMQQYFLSQAGYEVKTVAYFSANTPHVITIYKDPDTGKWQALEYYLQNDLNADSYEEALGKFMPGAFQMWEIDLGDNPDDSPILRTVIETASGLAVKGFFRGENIQRAEVKPGDHIGAAVYASENDITASLAFGEHFSVDARYYFNDRLPLLQDGVMVAGRWHPTENFTLSAGYGYLPNVYSLEVGSREQVDYPLQLGFIAANWDPTFYQGKVFRNVPDLIFTSSGELDFNVGAAFSDAYDFATIPIDTGVTLALSTLDFTWHNRLDYTVNDNLSLWVSNSHSYYSFTQIAAYLYTGGALSSVTPPFTNFFEIGANVEIDNTLLTGSVYLPLLNANNLYSDHATWNLSAHTQLGENSDLFATIMGDFGNSGLGSNIPISNIGIGANFGPVTANFAATGINNPSTGVQFEATLGANFSF